MKKKDLKISSGSGIETIQHYLLKNRLNHFNTKVRKSRFFSRKTYLGTRLQSKRIQ